jgi:hypothetical protein
MTTATSAHTVPLIKREEVAEAPWLSTSRDPLTSRSYTSFDIGFRRVEQGHVDGLASRSLFRTIEPRSARRRESAARIPDLIRRRSLTGPDHSATFLGDQ